MLLEILRDLISRPSITPEDAGCQDLLAAKLQEIGFVIEHMPFDSVKNLWARRGQASPLLLFIGHTDVVPPGPLNYWTYPPFEPTIRDDYLYGRGTADMKGSLATMLAACTEFVKKYPQHKGSIAWLITSDEEGASISGTAKVVEVLKARQLHIDWCLVGEPSSEVRLGDIAKIGRRGSLSGHLVFKGKQGHIAYPHLASNPIHKAIPFLKSLIEIEWDRGNDYFSPTSLQISNIHAGTGAGNVIPGELGLEFNFRYSPEVSAEQLISRVEQLLANYESHEIEIKWHHSGQAFLSRPGQLSKACSEAVYEVMGIHPKLSTVGGTSDGRFIAPLGPEILEIGPSNRTIHQIDERISLTELENLQKIYQKILERLLI